jgi:Fe2+ or Zn2+ uptake regulation protein
MSTEIHEIAAERLRRQDKRYTSNRRALVAALSAGRPMTLPELLAVSKGLPQSSAYRNLGLLEEAGVVRRIVGGGEFARYELAEDLTEHHHHLVCLTCGHVDDFTLPTAAEASIMRALQTAGTSCGFVIEGHRLDALGHCTNCQ